MNVMVVTRDMSYKTINITEGTYGRLVYYKHGNMTFDEVLNKLMDQISEEDFYRSILEEHKRIVAEMKKGQYLTQDELEEYLDR
jgi:predicted CopG family antitoxin